MAPISPFAGVLQQLLADEGHFRPRVCPCQHAIFAPKAIVPLGANRKGIGLVFAESVPSRQAEHDAVLPLFLIL